MRKNIDLIVALLAIVYLGMACSAYVFVEPVTTITLIIGGVAVGVLSLYGIFLSIAERKDEKYDQSAETVQARDQQKDQPQTKVWEETVMVEETQEGLGLSAL